MPWALGAARVWLVVVDGPRPKSWRRIRRAAGALGRLGRYDWLCRALAQEGRLALLAERWRLAARFCALATSVERRAPVPVPPAARAALWHCRGFAHWRLGQLDAARSGWEMALRSAQDAGRPEMVAGAHANLGVCLWAAGQPAAGYVQASAALNWFRAQARTAEVTQALYSAALMLEDFGHLADATVLLEEARAMADANGDREHLVDTSIELVHALLALGRLDEARTRLGQARRALAEIAPLPSMRTRRQVEQRVAEAHLRLAQRRPGDALRLLEGASAAMGSFNRPILSRRVAASLLRSARAGGGPATTTARLAACIAGMTPAPVSEARTLLERGPGGRERQERPLS
jgi:tetratricopeptide (TPR) repeat protein